MTIGHWARISKCIEFDAGHRVPRHESKCYNIHGHRYKVTAVCKGTIVEEHDAPDEGMLIDFGALKDFMMSDIHDVLDHGCILYRGDVNAIEALQNLGEFDKKPQKIIEFPYVPTAENIARWCFDVLNVRVSHHFRDNLILDHIEVYETPTSCASYPEVIH